MEINDNSAVFEVGWEEIKTKHYIKMIKEMLDSGEDKGSGRLKKELKGYEEFQKVFETAKLEISITYSAPPVGKIDK